MADAVGRKAGVDGDVGGTRLQHGEQGDDHVRGPRHGQRDTLFRTGAVLHEQSRQLVGPRVEFAVADQLSGTVQGGRHRGAGRLLLEQLRQQRVGHRRTGAVPFGEEPVALGRVQDVEAAHTLVGGGRHLLQQTPEPLPDASGLRVGEQSRPVVQAELGGGGARHHEERERVVRGVEDVDVRHPDIAVGSGERRAVQGIVLEDQDRVEQRPDARGLLDLGQPQRPVRDETRLLLLQPTQHRRHRLLGPHSRTYRHRVDEQADHACHVGYLRRPARHRGAEHHVVTAGQLSKEQAPCALDQRVHRDAAVACRGGQSGVEILRQLDADAAGGGQGVVRRVRCQQCGFLDPGECQCPLRECRLAVLAVEPLQILAVRGRRRQPRVLATPCVQRQQLCHHERHGPAVQQNVMDRQHQAMTVRAETDQQEPQERRPRQVELAVPVLVEQARQLRFLFVLGQAREVGLTPRQFDVACHHLHRLAHALVQETRAQHRVAAQQGLPGRPQRRHLHRALEVDRQLDRVDVVRPLVEEGVEDQPFLQGRERENVLYARLRHSGVPHSMSSMASS
ncbi:hypothetical protein RKD29_006613 [Streptomyces tendae]